MMPRADLYLIPGSAFSDVCEFCIRLTSKAFRAGHRIHIKGSAAHETESLDRLLWEADKASFLPHVVLEQDSATTEQTPITLSNLASTYPPAEHRDLLIQYDSELPDQLKTFKRLALIVPNTEPSIHAARITYKALTAQEFSVNTHDLRN